MSKEGNRPLETIKHQPFYSSYPIHFVGGGNLLYVTPGVPLKAKKQKTSLYTQNKLFAGLSLPAETKALRTDGQTDGPTEGHTLL